MDMSYVRIRGEKYPVCFSLTAVIPFLAMGVSYLISCRIVEGKEF